MEDVENNQDIEKVYDQITHQRAISVFMAIGKFALENPALLLTTSYLGLILVGGLYQLGYFKYFHINILEFAAPTDFLLKPFRNRIALALPLLGLVFVLAIVILLPVIEYRLARIKKKKDNGDELFTNIVMLVGFFLFFAPYYIGYHDAWWKSRPKRRSSYDVELRSNNAQSEEFKDLHLIGTTSNFYFFSKGLKHETKYTIPISNISSMKRADTPKSRWKFYAIVILISIAVCFAICFLGILIYKIKLAIGKYRIKKYCKAGYKGVLKTEFVKELEQKSEKLLKLKREESETQGDFIKRIAKHVGYSIPEDVDFSQIESEQ